MGLVVSVVWGEGVAIVCSDDQASCVYSYSSSSSGSGCGRGCSCIAVAVAKVAVYSSRIVVVVV